METGNVNATTKPHKISGRRKQLKPSLSSRTKAESVPEKLFNNVGDTVQNCLRNSENVKSDKFSGKYEQMAHFNATRIENQQATEDEEGPAPLAIAANASVEDEENTYEPAIKDEQEPAKQRTNSENRAHRSRICEQETYAQLEAKIKKLKNENSMSRHDMQEISVSCWHLRKKNRRLLKKLKKVCPPDTIAYLEARNPEKKADNPGSTQQQLITM